MKILYGVKREVFKGNKCMPEETIIYPNIYKTLEEAVRFMVKDTDFSILNYGYEPGDTTHYSQCTSAIQTIHNSKTGKDTVFRHEWSLIRFELDEENNKED